MDDGGRAMEGPPAADAARVGPLSYIEDIYLYIIMGVPRKHIAYKISVLRSKTRIKAFFGFVRLRS
jgi:hypothetical protein